MSEYKSDSFYSKEEVGIDYSPEMTKFSVWSPDALEVNLVLYNDADDLHSQGEIISMSKENGGIWFKTVERDLKNKLYSYQVNLNNKVLYAVDPYAKGLSQNGGKGVILDLEDTDPKGWKADKRPDLKRLEDSIIYEMHVRDFSISEDSGMKYKGKYLAFTEEGTQVPGTDIKTGIDHLKELGITHIHLLPIFDFGSVDEREESEYNWGYDPVNYNAPEGSYSTDSTDPISRIKELKSMVQTLHKNGIRVVMDVVYNHTYTSESSSFGKLAPKEYYRYKSDGELSNGSGCGNEVASDNPMVRKFIVDSVKYWANEYHIDGFRFDLMALHDKETMKLVKEELREIDSGILIYGEPWMADYSPLDFEKQLRKGEQRGMEIGVFNDNLRDALKGSTRGEDRGYATGRISNSYTVKEGIVGGVNSFADNPQETINYVSAHDDLTLWDKIDRSNAVDSQTDKVKMNNLCNAIVLTSQGIPFLHGGVELLRTKYGVANSYSSSDKINQIEWQKKEENYSNFLYYRGLIKLRKQHPAFRMQSTEDIRANLNFLEVSDGLIAYSLKGNLNGDKWDNIVVIFNPHHEEMEVTLPQEGEWKVVVKEDKAGVETLEVIKGQGVLVPRISAMVLYQ